MPYIKTSGEFKTKPTQHSVKELRSIGIQPDILVCRSEQGLSEGKREKIALFTNVSKNGVVSLPDVQSIYSIPNLLKEQGVDELVIKSLNLSAKEANLAEWQAVVDAESNTEDEVTISMVGKYTSLSDAYKSVNEALKHAGIHHSLKVNIHYVDAEVIERSGTDCLQNSDAILVPGGFGERGVEGMIRACQFARENNVPYFGICLGLQIAMIEYARHKLNLNGANSTEFDRSNPYPVIALVSEWADQSTGEIQKRSHDDDLGGTMRLGLQKCSLIPKTMTHHMYASDEISERHRHRYEVNESFISKYEEAGMVIAARSEQNRLVECIELPNHPWFFASQFHPEFLSTPRDPHPVFNGFIAAAYQHKQSKD